MVFNMGVLVLNKKWIPIKIISDNSAICKIFSGKAMSMSLDLSLLTWEEWIDYSKKNKFFNTINGVNFFINKPFIIVQTSSCNNIKKPKPTRKNIFIRDNFTCQYCGNVFNKSHLTIDHVIPRSKGGETTWTNSVTSCSKCNNKKSDKSINDSRMSLIKKPKEPSYYELFLNSVKDKEWRIIIKKMGGIK